MLIYLAGILGLFVLLDTTIRSDRAEARNFAVSHRFFALRDRVRMAAIEGKIGDWCFDYLDTSITATIAFVERLSFWELFRLLVNRWEDERIAKAYSELQGKLKKAGPEATALYDAFVLEWLNALSERHALFLASLKMISRTALWANKAMETLRRQVIFVVVGAPETSTLLEHCGRRARARS